MLPENLIGQCQVSVERALIDLVLLIGGKETVEPLIKATPDMT